MQRNKIVKWLIKLALFTLILVLGTFMALAVNETTGLALTELPNAPVQAAAGYGDDTFYATLDDPSQPAALYRSSDRGHTWEVIKPNLDPAAITTLAVDPHNSTVLYAGTAGGPLDQTNNVWRSLDGGETWQNFNMTLPANPDLIVPAVTALEIDPNRPDVLYVGTAGHGVYQFDEDQVGYTLVGGVTMPQVNIHDLVIDANSRLYALTSKGLFRLEGDMWQRIDTLPGTVGKLAVARLNPQIMFASIPPNGVYRSEDGGQTWEHTVTGLNWTPGSGLRATALAVDPKNPANVVAATAYELGIHHLSPAGIYSSETGGESWTRIDDTNTLVTHLSFTPDGVLAATNNGLRQYDVFSTPTGPSGSPQPTLVRVRPVVDKIDSLFPLSGIQILIFALTLSLAALVLVGRFNWFMPRQKNQ